MLQVRVKWIEKTGEKRFLLKNILHLKVNLIETKTWENLSSELKVSDRHKHHKVLKNTLKKSC